ncbi:MAG: class I SAM-dependent methyltransferase [Methanoregulaceae archaeon]|nr:class I SAM-dependent methyltransferase [Methanoregulaceae archaeon]
MLFLSEKEKQDWAGLAKATLSERYKPGSLRTGVRPNLYAAFCFFIGTFLASHGQGRLGSEWLRAGAMEEEEGLFCGTFLLGFLQRHEMQMIAPVVAFEDPRPFVHFAGVPVMREARTRFINQCGHTLPVFDRPINFMDIGCGDGALTISLLKHLQETGKVDGIHEILLVDSSPAMIELARQKVHDAFPDVVINTENARIQDCSGKISHYYDIAMSSLAYHHMPFEHKLVHLNRLKPWIDHFILFEMDANNDSPEVWTPDLALSVYQSYGRIIDFVYAYDAPVDVVTDCVDSFLMTELISLLTAPRGVRSDYHMLSSQWNDLFKQCLSPEFTLRCNSTCYADEYLTLFSMHYGREE